MAKVKITGLKELKKDLKKLSEKDQRNITRSALRAGASEISKRAKANAPSDEGDLKKSIGVTKRKTLKTITKFSVSPQINKSITVKGERKVIDGRHAIHVEYGTQFQQAQPFMRNTFDSLGQNVADSISKQMAKRIEKASDKK